jgi:HK97 gp10 family phage protein
MAGGVRVEGLKELQDKLRGLGAGMAARQLRGAAKDALERTETVARARAPVGDQIHKTYKGRVVTPGFAARSIKRAALWDRARNVARAVVGVASEAFYALSFVERGTSRAPAQPWLVPAFHATSGQVLADFKASLKARIERIAKRRK